MVMKLDSFYRSDAWRNLLVVLKQERVKGDGFIYCEYCGNPIVKAYDCIGHHTTELTEFNVHDADISLNPERIQLVHHRCHNRIHNKFGGLGYNSRRIYLVYGSPLSGKTEWVNQCKVDGDLIVDMDSIWECISGCDRYIKPGRLNAVAFDIRDRLIESIKLRRGKWRHAYIIGGYPLISERERLCKELGAEEVFIDTSKEECLARLSSCEDGRDKVEWEKYIESWWTRYTPPTS